MGFFLTANWAVLGGAAVRLVALLAIMPRRSSLQAFAEAARLRQNEQG
jgi:hypothetical protein